MLDLTQLRTRGRAKKEPAIAYVRDLEPADLALLATEKGVKAPALKRIRDVHHALARCLASGMSEAEAGLATGYCSSRISILKADPTFNELLCFYRDNAVKEFGDFTDRLVQTAKMAQEEIQDRLDTAPESFDNDQLRKLMVETADRAGYAPNKGKNVTVNVNLAGRLERARQRLDQIGDTLDNILDVTPETPEGDRLALGVEEEPS